MTRRNKYEGDPAIDVALLPENLAFETMVDRNATRRQTNWDTDENFEIDGSRLPGPLTDGFFFPERSRIQAAKFDLAEYLDTDSPMWHLQGEFSVEGGFDYKVRLNNQAGERAVIETSDFNGNVISGEVDSIDLLEFLLVLYNEHLNRSRDGKTVDIIDLLKSHKDYRKVDNTTFSRLLPRLGKLSGKTESRTIAEVPFVKGNRNIFILLSKKITPEQDSIEVDIDIASETSEGEVPIDRVILHSASSSPPIESDGIHAKLSKIDIPLSSFRTYREIPDLLNASVSSHEQIDGSINAEEKTDPKLFKIAKTCMYILNRSFEEQGKAKPEQP